MKKWFIGIALLLLLLALATFLLLPSQIVVQQSVFVNASAKSSYRCLTENAMIEKWWKAGVKLQNLNDTLPFTDSKWKFRLKPLMYNGAEVEIMDGDKMIQSIITINSFGKDSSYLKWKAEWPKTQNPMARLQQYWQARAVKSNMQKVLQQFSSFINSPDKVYGLHITKTKVKDTLIATTKKVFKSYPTTADYYAMIESLQQHIASSGAQTTNFPMLNISPIANNEFGVMVGLPVNKAIPESNGIQLKRMIPGNILVTEVAGGVHHVELAMQELHNYIQENGLLPPAIPYQSLVTDRRAEPDTSRWITKLYFPVY